MFYFVIFLPLMYNCAVFKDGEAAVFVLAVSRGYPSEKYHGSGIFEFDQAKALAKAGCKVEISVVKV